MQFELDCVLTRYCLSSYYLVTKIVFGSLHIHSHFYHCWNTAHTVSSVLIYLKLQFYKASAKCWTLLNHCACSLTNMLQRRWSHILANVCIPKCDNFTSGQTERCHVFVPVFVECLATSGLVIYDPWSIMSHHNKQSKGNLHIFFFKASKASVQP